MTRQKPVTTPEPATVPTSVADELAAMRRIVATLDKLDDASSDRVVNWMYDRYRRDADQ